MCLSGLVQVSPSTRHGHYLNTTQLGGLLSTDVFNCASDAKTPTPRPLDCGVGLPWVKAQEGLEIMFVFVFAFINMP